MKFATAAIAELGGGLQQPSLATYGSWKSADIVDLIVPFEIPERPLGFCLRNHPRTRLPLPDFDACRRSRTIFGLLSRGADDKHAAMMRNVDLPMLAPLRPDAATPSKTAIIFPFGLRMVSTTGSPFSSLR